MEVTTSKLKNPEIFTPFEVTFKFNSESDVTEALDSLKKGFENYDGRDTPTSILYINREYTTPILKMYYAIKFRGGK